MSKNDTNETDKTKDVESEAEKLRPQITYVPPSIAKAWGKRLLADEFFTQCDYVERIVADGAGLKVIYMPKTKGAA